MRGESTIFGISGTEALLLMAILVMIVGPSRLPHVVKSARGLYDRACIMWREVEQRSHQTLTEGLKESGLEELDPRQLWEQSSSPHRENPSFVAVPPPLPSVDDPVEQLPSKDLDGRGGQRT